MDAKKFSTKPGQSFCTSLFSNAFEKGINSSLLSQDVGKIVGQTGLFSLDEATSLEEGKTLNSKPE